MMKYHFYQETLTIKFIINKIYLKFLIKNKKLIFIFPIIYLIIRKELKKKILL